METLLFDRAQKQIGRLLPDLVTPTEIDDLNGEHRLIFSYPSAADYSEHIKESNFVACQDMDHSWQLYEIIEVRDRIDTVEAVCNHAYYALAGMEFVSGACEGSALTALTRVLAGTGWEPGIVEPQASRTVSFQHVSPWTAVAEIADYWGGELRFRVDISGARIAHKYIDLLTRRGDVTGKRFEFGRDIRDIDITLNRSAVVTALYGWGQGESIPEDGEETERLTFADVEWVKGEGAELHPGGLTSPAPCDKPLGQLWVGDDAARQAYGRYDPGAEDFKHVFGEYDSQAKSPQALLWETWRQLQKRNEPLVNVKATVADLEQVPGLEHEKVRLGDTCYIILPDIPPLAARVIRIERRRKDPGQTKVELGNFRPVQGERIADIERRVKRADSRSGVWDRARVVNPDGTLPASVLDGPIDAVQNQIKAGGGEVLMDEEGFRVLDTDDPETALSKIHGVARDGEAALVLGKRASPINPWEERVGMTSDGFRLFGEEIVAGLIQAARLQIGADSVFEEGYDPSTKTEQAEHDDLSNVVSEHSSLISANSDEILLKASRTDVDLLQQTVEHNSAEISTVSEQVAIEITRLDGDIGAASEGLSEVKSYFTFREDGFTLGKSDSPLNINISNEQMDFADAGQIVAYINGQKMFIGSLEVLTSLLVGVHVIEKYDDETTLIRWVG